MPNFLQENNYMLNDLAAHSQREQQPGPVAHAAQTTDFSFTFTTQNGTRLLLHAVSAGILRFRYLPPGAPAEPDFSYALPGPDEPYPTRPAAPTALTFKEEIDHYRLATAQLVCVVEKATLRTRVLDHAGNLLSADEQGFSWRYDDDTGNDHVQLSHRVPAGAAYYGLGDKPTALNLRGQRLVNWGSDTYGYEYGRDPLYKNIPFYYVLHQRRAHGIFFDNTFKTHFDFAAERPDATSFGAEGGELNYYFLNGPALLDVAEAYTRLTGPAPLPPLWALGYHQCKWSYFPESNLREIAQGLRARRIPCDAVYLDIDYMDGYRCFTWHPEHFPEPRRLVRELAEDGFKLVVIIDPGIKIDPDYAVYQEGVENDYFCRRADGPLMRGSVWPGACHFPDYTRPEVRAWWASLFEELIQDVGVRGIWTDMNEPAVFERGTFPDDVRFGYDGQPGSHRKAHNIYGMQMARATAAGAARFGYPRRPFAITRSTYAGGQRHACVWTGDNVATWEHLALANVQCQRLSISGFSFAGSDIGGFIGTPSGELYARWVALGAFHPFFRTHSSGDHGDQEPWSFGEPYTSRARQFIELRYQLLPYVYTAFWQYSTRGTPMLRPLTFLDQHDPETYLRQAEFGFGDSLLVCPVMQAGAEGRWLYLPKGEWYYYWDDAPTAGSREVWAAADLTRIPLYVRAGAVLPMQPVLQYVGEKPVEELTLHVYFKNGIHQSVLYDDGGEGYGHQQGDQTVRRFTVVGNENSLVIRQEIEGDYQPSYATYRVVLHGLPGPMPTAVVDGQPVGQAHGAALVVAAGFAAISLHWPGVEKPSAPLPGAVGPPLAAAGP